MPFGRDRRVITPILPARRGTEDGLAYAVWLPETSPKAGVVIVHGAGSQQESHYDYARMLLAYGIASVTFDQRGHGASGGSLDARVLHDIAAMAELLRRVCETPALPVALRGSSMGGYFALVAAAGPVDAVAVVAICPAGAEGLRRGLNGGSFPVAADVPGLDAFLSEHDEHVAAAMLEIPVLILHAEGDEVVPVEHSRELARRLTNPSSRLITLPGGHHRSVQHDEELQAVSVRFIEQALRDRR